MGAVNFARGHLELPLVVFWDLLHQGVNDVLLAVNRAGMWPTILELLLVFRLPYGPWAGQKFWHDLQDASKLGQAAGMAQASHFQTWLGERLLKETGAAEPLHTCWETKGVRATLGRWFSWWWANKALRKVWWSKLSTLLFTLVINKKMPLASVFHDLSRLAAHAGLDLQMAEASRKRKRKTQSPGLGPGESAPEAAEPTDLAASSQKNKAAQTKSMMQVAAAALAQERNFDISAMLHHFVEPFAMAHKELVTTLRGGPEATRGLYVSLAKGGKLAPCHEAVLKLAAAVPLSECALLVECLAEAHLEAMEDSPDVVQQDTLAGQLEGLVWQLCRQTAVTSSQFTDTIMGQLASFWEEEPGGQEACLQWLQERQAVFAQADKVATPAVQNLLHKSDCRWPVEQRIMKRLSLVDFAHFPEEVKRDLQSIFSAEPSTGIVENSFKELRAAEKSSSSGEIEKMTRHRTLLDSDLPARFNRVGSLAERHTLVSTFFFFHPRGFVAEDWFLKKSNVYKKELPSPCCPPRVVPATKMRADAYNTTSKSCPPPSLKLSKILGRLYFIVFS